MHDTIKNDIIIASHFDSRDVIRVRNDILD